MSMLRRIARSFGYDLLPRKKAKIPSTRLVALLDHHRINTVFDVGANVGQYGKRLRSSGYKGRIISFEPLTAAHAELSRAAAGDPFWEVAPPMAIGDAEGATSESATSEGAVVGAATGRPLSSAVSVTASGSYSTTMLPLTGLKRAVRTPRCARRRSSSGSMVVSSPRSKRSRTRPGRE